MLMRLSIRHHRGHEPHQGLVVEASTVIDVDHASDHHRGGLRLGDQRCRIGRRQFAEQDTFPFTEKLGQDDRIGRRQ